ncbi:hypothetical protein ONS95_014216 [Cadophora gregata]|uniref:uncharacterized protein n=1 Tax=Cadophora gregata TaxID=51156 RepID=UPI0026DAC877|nr:uncharacterized protein ONS95_014216 [Cadophora gregata]KAK0113973.1 hypothetical protein ONS96_014820 [Cadophora gregata f. sp. sojae]KAK0114731.1 hypothetical protein ONS95_014216 [Cadophora gregata]
MSLLDFVSFTKTWHNEPYPAIDPKRPELSAKGKFVVVTGGGTGIGRAIAVAFAEAGAQTIAIVGRRIDRLEGAAAEINKVATANNVKVLFESADMSKRASLDAAVENLTKKAGGSDVKVDIFIHSAAVTQDRGNVKGYDESSYRYGLELNVLGAFNALQAFAPVLTADAHIYNISSGMAHIAPIWIDDWAYAAGKAAVVKMFDYLQAQQPEWHVVQLQPGVVSTELNASFGVVGPDTPELCGHFAVWLASPGAAFLKGKFVWANWDVEELKARANEVQSSSLLRVALNGVDM